VRLAKPLHYGAWLGLLAVCGLLLAGAVSGCATTQDTAVEKQAESKRILEAREKRQRQRSESHDKGGRQR
jgi:hypothetical protein